MRMSIIALLLTGVLASSGCTSASKQKGTVRQTKPDDPREEKLAKSRSKKEPPPLPRLEPDQINEDNYQQQVKALQMEMDRELREIRRVAESPITPPTDEMDR
jgi:hypothetical protein